MSTTCRNCGFSLDDDDAFCGNCGQTLTAAQPGTPPEGSPWRPSGGPDSGAGAVPGRAYGAGGEAYRAQEQPYPEVSGDPAAGYRPPPGYAPPAPAAYPAARPGGSAKGFVGSLFDFGFTSFVTPLVVKVLYVLIMIVLGLVGLGSVVIAFAVNTVLGIFTLIIAAPLSFFISLALYRIILELFVVIFRVAEDIHAIRERGDLR
jgi:hypothetical protein